MSLEDTKIMNQAYEMREVGMYVSDIAKELSEQTGQRITQMALWRLLNDRKKREEEANKEPDELEYPSRDELENIFSVRVKNGSKRAGEYHGTQIRRDFMAKILKKYMDKEFTYDEVRRDLNSWATDEQFYQHFDYLKHYNYILKVSDTKFKFCDRVKKWKRFGEV